MFSLRYFAVSYFAVSGLISVYSWAPNNKYTLSSRCIDRTQKYTSQYEPCSSYPKVSQLLIFKTKDEDATEIEAEVGITQKTVEETTEQYGLEAGLFQSMKKNDAGQSAKDLLAKYGVAYLATSIPLALVSFAICFVLVDSGVDIAGLLKNIGIEVSDSSEKVGTFALAYAAHKAASPIRFPPTVLLTPVVAKLIGKEPNEA
mmetsp:Transcript_16510/g.20181  ORF Transcript_16510/g.20181 Transcript_16510/m.20181 type:complete len:202 (+) Transcript_16510:144-749(+)